MATDPYLIRKMSRNELDLALAWAAAEGWNPGLYDADCFYAADPNGFYIGILDGEPISSISVVKYGAAYGFLGLYIVKPEQRGKGYGLRLWNEAMQHLEQCTVGLDGVPAQQGNYARSGFQLAYQNARYQGAAAGKKTHSHPGIVDLSQVALDELQAYDEELFSIPRPEFLRAWMRQPESISLGILDEEKLAGYTLLRRCHTGYKIGPLFANNAGLAEALFQELSARLPEGTPLFLDVPEERLNPAATQLAKRHGMEIVFETARMYRLWDVSAMHLPLERWFGVTTFELG